MHTESVPVTMFYSMYAYLSHIPRLHALGIAVFAYVVYYLIQVVKVSRVETIFLDYVIIICYSLLASNNCVCRWTIQAVPDPKDAHIGEQVLAHFLVCGEPCPDCSCEPAALPESSACQLPQVCVTLRKVAAQ